MKRNRFVQRANSARANSIKNKGIEFRMLFLDPKTDLSLLDEKEQLDLKESVQEVLRRLPS